MKSSMIVIAKMCASKLAEVQVNKSNCCFDVVTVLNILSVVVESRWAEWLRSPTYEKITNAVLYYVKQQLDLFTWTSATLLTHILAMTTTLLFIIVREANEEWTKKE